MALNLSGIAHHNWISHHNRFRHLFGALQPGVIRRAAHACAPQWHIRIVHGYATPPLIIRICTSAGWSYPTYAKVLLHARILHVRFLTDPKDKYASQDTRKMPRLPWPWDLIPPRRDASPGASTLSSVAVFVLSVQAAFWPLRCNHAHTG